MAAQTPVREVMNTNVVSFEVGEDVGSVMRALVEHNINGAPVLDESGAVVGVISSGDLIVKESRLHFPTVISFLAGSFEFKQRGFDDDLAKALSSRVEQVMSKPAVTVDVSATVGEAATLMHDRRVARLPVVDAGALVGIVSRSDLLRGMLADE
ncbi:MAG: CBS domain-containing protein [Acidimicrobiia bacterium]